MCWAHLLRQLHHCPTTVSRHIGLGGTVRIHCNEQLNHQSPGQSPRHWQQGQKSCAKLQFWALSCHRLSKQNHSLGTGHLQFCPQASNLCIPKSFPQCFSLAIPLKWEMDLEKAPAWPQETLELSLSEVSDGRVTRRGQLWWLGIMGETSNLSHRSAWKSRGLKNNLSAQCCRT